jgi:lipoprotein-anchoring transpeptidase ErfK/SrfK
MAALMMAVLLPSASFALDARIEDQDNGEDSIASEEIPDLFSLYDLDALADFDGKMDERMADTSASKVVVTVSKSSQRMTVSVNGSTKYSGWKVSTGKPGSETRSGTFTPFEMNKNYFSKRFKVILPYGIKFDGGNLIHAASKGGVTWLGQKRSHGCVRLLPSNAKLLYSLVANAGMKNTRVIVH